MSLPGSSVKRKREVEDRYPAKAKWNRSAVKSNTTNIDTQDMRIDLVNILSNGSILIISEGKLYLYPHATRHFVSESLTPDERAFEPVVVDLLIDWPRQSPLFVRDNITNSTIGALTGAQPLEIVCGSIDGGVQFWRPFADQSNNGTTSSFEMLLSEGDEGAIVDIALDNGIVFLLSKFGQIYLIRRRSSSGSEVEGFVFQRSISLVQGLWLTGARLLGVAREARTAHAFKLLPVPQHGYLVALGSKLSVWSQYSIPGQESVLLECNLSRALKLDIVRAQSRGSVFFGTAEDNLDEMKIKLIDACLVQSETRAQQIDLLVLSAVTSGDESLDETDRTAALYLHVLEIPLQHLIQKENSPTNDGSSASTTPTAGTSDKRLILRQRYLLASDALIPSMRSQQQHVTSMPRLCSMEPTWRVYVTWTTADASHQLKCLQLDILHCLLTSTAGHNTAAEESGVPALTAIDATSAAVSTQIASRDVGCIATVSGFDGAVVVHASPSVFSVLSPPLASIPTALSSTARPSTLAAKITNGTVAQGGAVVLQGLDLDRVLSETFASLSAIVTHKVTLDSQLGNLRNTFLRLSSSDSTRVIQRVSETLIDRHPAGRYWGGALPLRNLAHDAKAANQNVHSSYNALHEFQFAHRVIQEKVAAHGLLLQTIAEADGLRHGEVLQLLLANHAKVSFAAAVAEALEDRMDRVSDPVYQDVVHTAVSLLQQAVIAQSTLSVEEMQSKGLTPYDQFYAEVSKVYVFVTHAIELLTQEISQTQSTIALLMRLAALFVSILQLSTERTNNANNNSASSAPEERDPQLTHLLTHLPLRHALVHLIAAIQTRLSTTHDAARADLATVLSEEDGVFLHQLSDTLLGSFVQEAREQTSVSSEHRNGNNNSLNHISESDRQAVEILSGSTEHVAWRQNFYAAQTSLVQLMLELHWHRMAFQVSQKYWFPRGLFLATAQAPSVHKSSFDRLLTQYGQIFYTAPGGPQETLAQQYFTWLASTGGHQRILVDGAMNNQVRGHLQQFFDARTSSPASSTAGVSGEPSNSTRHHLQMTQQVREKDYLSGALEAVRLSETQSTVEEAKTTLSLAKLSAVLAQRKLDHKIHTTSNASDKNSYDEADRRQVQEVLLRVNQTQDVLVIQESLVGDESQDGQRRLAPVHLAQLAVTRLQEQVRLHAGSETQSGWREDAFLCAARTLVLLGAHLRDVPQHANQHQQAFSGVLETLWRSVVEADYPLLSISSASSSSAAGASSSSLALQLLGTSQEVQRLKSQSLLCQVLLDGLAGVHEGNLPIELLWPLFPTSSSESSSPQRSSTAGAGSDLGFATIVQTSVQQLATRDELARGDRERIQGLYLALASLVRHDEPR